MQQIAASRPDAGASKSAEQVEESARVLLGFILAALGIAGVAVVTVLLAAPWIPIPDVESLRSEFVERWHRHLNPEPIERVVYAAVIIVIVPIVVTVSAKLRRTALPSRFTAGLALGVSLFFAALIFPTPFMLQALTGDISGDAPLDLKTGILVCLSVAASVALLGYAPTSRSPLIWRTDRSAAVDYALLAAVLLTSVAVRLRTADMVAGDMHFEAAFYAVTQVVAGRTLLADLPAQYGLYGELLAPLFKATGLSVLGFSALLVAFQAAAGASLLAVTALLIRLYWLRILAVFSIFMFVGSTWLVIELSPIGREYYQIWPVRFLFPAISLLFFVLARKRFLPLWQVAALGALSGLAMIWNLDSGVPVFGALMAVLLARVAFGPTRVASLWSCSAGLLAAATVVAVLMFYLWIKSDGTIAFSDWLKYQRIFYASGFGMLPMPLGPHPWVAVFALYVLALCVGVAATMRRESSVVSDSLIYLAVLGFGLFTYFQGRSHDIVLSFVIWPAILIAFVLADWTLRAARSGLLPSAMRWGALPVIVFGFLMTFVWISTVPRLVTMTTEVANRISHRNSGPTAEAVRFISEQVGASGEAVIISSAQALYFGETGLASAVAGPGWVEMLLQEDMDQFLNALTSSRIDHVFIDANADGQLPELYQQALSGYRVSRSFGRLLHLVPSAPSESSRQSSRGNT